MLNDVTSNWLFRYFDQYSYGLDINTVNAQTITESFLLENDIQMLILDSDFNVVQQSGVPIVEKPYFTSTEVIELVSNTNPEQGYYASLKPIDSATTAIKYAESSDACASLQSVPALNTVPSDYLLILQQDIVASEFDYNMLGVYTNVTTALMALLVIVVLMFFIRSIYLPLKANFEIIEDNLSRPLYDNSPADLSLATLKESQSVLHAYNDMASALSYESEQKQRAVELNRQLIQNLAHDLKSPITVLKGYSEVLASEDVDSTAQKEYISYIGKSANDLNNLVSLLFEQITYQNGNNLSFEKFDVNAILREICANYYMIFDKRGFDFVSDISETAYVTSIDTVNIKRVFTNLLQNILNHNETPTKVLVSSYKDDSGFVIKVMDDGAGITDENKEKVFDAFFQEDSVRNTQNSGIGLYIVRQIIEKHGGDISISSQPDFKTVFTIHLK